LKAISPNGVVAAMSSIFPTVKWTYLQAVLNKKQPGGNPPGRSTKARSDYFFLKASSPNGVFAEMSSIFQTVLWTYLQAVLNKKPARWESTELVD
jgi:hypothetical protein